MIVYISIGNSDDKLTQAEWSEFVFEITHEVIQLATTVHGAWFSDPVSEYQNACWCVEFSTDEDADEARAAATHVRKKYQQDSVAWGTAEMQFI